MPTSASNSIDTLNRVLAVLQRSFPQYLRYARPYVPPGRENVMQTIHDIVAAQDALGERVSDAVMGAGGLPDTGEFPIEYADTHDLGIDFLIDEAVDCQKSDVADLEQCVAALRSAPAAESLAAEALGMAKGQLELLVELQGAAAKGPSNGQPA